MSVPLARLLEDRHAFEKKPRDTPVFFTLFSGLNRASLLRGRGNNGKVAL